MIVFPSVEKCIKTPQLACIPLGGLLIRQPGSHQEIVQHVGGVMAFVGILGYQLSDFWRFNGQIGGGGIYDFVPTKDPKIYSTSFLGLHQTIEY